MDQRKHDFILRVFPGLKIRASSYRQRNGRPGAPVTFYEFDDGWMTIQEAYRRALRVNVQSNKETRNG